MSKEKENNDINSVYPGKIFMPRGDMLFDSDRLLIKKIEQEIVILTETKKLFEEQNKKVQKHLTNKINHLLTLKWERND